MSQNGCGNCVHGVRQPAFSKHVECSVDGWFPAVHPPGKRVTDLCPRHELATSQHIGWPGSDNMSKCSLEPMDCETGLPIEEFYLRLRATEEATA